MTVLASIAVIEDKKFELVESLGEFEFVSLPSKGDTIPITSLGGTGYMYEVVSLRHSPVCLEEKLDDDDVPAVIVFVSLSGLEP